MCYFNSSLKDGLFVVFLSDVYARLDYGQCSIVRGYPLQWRLVVILGGGANKCIRPRAYTHQ